DGSGRRQHAGAGLADGHRRPPRRPRRARGGARRRGSAGRPLHGLLRGPGACPPARLRARGAGGGMSAGAAAAPRPPEKSGLSVKAKVFLGLAAYFALVIALLLIFGDAGKNEAFQPQNEFKLEPWISIEIAGIDLSVNKAVLYLVLAS